MAPSSHTRTDLARRRIAFFGNAALLVMVVLQWRSISQLREEFRTIRAQPKAMSSNPVVPPPSTAPSDPVDRESWKHVRQELQQLRDDLRLLKERSLPATAAVTAISGEPVTPGTTTPPSEYEDARVLVTEAMRGNSHALEKLATRVAGMLQLKPETQESTAAGIRSAFDFLGEEAGKGDASALQTIWRASRIQELEGFATTALGQAAALGNEEALRPLLEPEAFFLLRSSATSALKPAADAGNERAIQALAATAADPAHQPLWLLAAQGLKGAASAGNVTAIESLARIADSANEAIRREAVLALEAAARKNHPQAEEALKRLGWR